MALRNSSPLVWSPHGASDTLDSSTAFQGAMALLQNLIPDPTTKNLWQCRPAARLLFDPSLAGFNTPTFISVLYVLGTRVYGMMSTARNAGRDEPFVYDIPTASFIAVSGVTAANSPVSPPTVGTWQPPSMALVGSKIVVAHQGFNGLGAAFFGVLDISNPAAPTWTAQNTTGAVQLPSAPVWVVNFGGRAFYLCNPVGQQPGAYMSDVLVPTNITNGTQILTFNDNMALTCAVGLSLENQLGGIIQSLMVFKGVTNIYQITGDFALGTLAINTLNVATGTLAPNSIQSTSKGLAFMAPDGLRIIDFKAVVSDPIGVNGDGINVPFVGVLTPSRICAAYNNGIYRVQVQNGLAPGNPQQQWWFDFTRQLWSGPHTQLGAQMKAYSNTFVVSLQDGGAKVFTSDTVQSSTSTFNENGVALQWQWATPMLPDTDQMTEISMVETTIHMALVAANSVVASAVDQGGNIIDTVTLTVPGAQTLWGAFTWGAALWQGAQNALYPRRIPWHFPIVFRRLGLLLQGVCATGFKIGRLHMKYEILGYLQQDAGGTGTFVAAQSTGLVTLTANATTTVVTNAACQVSSAIYLMPNTPDAANDMATTSIVASAGFFTITHANNARVDRTFTYSIFN